jgi:hypothetical protein
MPSPYVDRAKAMAGGDGTVMHRPIHRGMGDGTGRRIRGVNWGTSGRERRGVENPRYKMPGSDQRDG